MGDYDYLNARVRGMSTELLSRDFYEQVLSSFTEDILTSALMGSAYAEELQKARERQAAASASPPSTPVASAPVASTPVAGPSTSMPVARAIECAVWSRSATALARLLAAAPPVPRRLLALQLNRWDVTNIAALLRARLAGVEPHEALSAVLPIGELTAARLAELAAERDVESLADALTTWKLPVFFELRQAIRQCPDPRSPRALERALYCAYFAWALAQLRESDPHESLVRESVRRHIDMMNVISVLTSIREARGSEPEECDSFDRGLLEAKFLKELSRCGALEDAFEMLVGSYLGPGVEKGILTYGQSQSLGVMERFLEAITMEHACRLFRLDLLGVAVPLGFIWRTVSECMNLRLLARGMLYGMPPNTVRQELVLV